MTLYIIKYLFPLIFEGEKTSRELAEEIGGFLYNASHAMGILQRLGLARHPGKRVRSWEVDSTKKIVLTLEKLLIVSKNDPQIKKLFDQATVVKIGSKIYKHKKGVTVEMLVKSASVSRVSALKVLDKLSVLTLLMKKVGKPNIYYVPNTMLSRLFFESCSEIEKVFYRKEEKELSPQEIIKKLKNDTSVLILVHYGSSSRGTGDKLSDIDLLVVTRDPITRGDILSRYSHKKIDLGVYSKSGFLQLLKTNPDFIGNISTAKVLKGKDILEPVIQ